MQLKEWGTICLAIAVLFQGIGGCLRQAQIDGLNRRVDFLSGQVADLDLRAQVADLKLRLLRGVLAEEGRVLP